jgi:hypothetical protein
VNVDNWWGVLYGIFGTLTLCVLVMVVLAFAAMRGADMAQSRTWTDEELELNRALRDRNRDHP